MLKKFCQPKVLLFALFGIIIGTALMIPGYASEAPGLSLIGLLSAFFPIMRAIYHTEIFRKGFHIPIVLLVLGTIAALLPIKLFFEGEVEEFFPFVFIGIAAGLGIEMQVLRRHLLEAVYRICRLFLFAPLLSSCKDPAVPPAKKEALTSYLHGPNDTKSTQHASPAASRILCSFVLVSEKPKVDAAQQTALWSRSYRLFRCISVYSIRF